MPLSKQRVAKVRKGAALVPRDFYLDSPDLVAQKLLGKLLVRGEMAGRIVEVEAYFGEADPASHSFAGRTARNAVLFGPPGHAYVYFIYGMYFCLNASCEPDGIPGGVLFRALEPVSGLEAMARARGVPANRVAALTSGPGRLCQAFGVTRERDNGADFTSPKSELQIRDDGFVAGEILVTPRIGISKDADRPARFVLAGNPFVSKRG
ncbi:MAG: DNA-3-methyladenine glycosylase [Acidobacteriaceae bacterium]